MTKRFLRCGFCGMPRHESRREFMRCVRAALELARDLGVLEYLTTYGRGDALYRP